MLTLSLLAYLVTGILIHPRLAGAARATLIPSIQLTPDFLALAIAVLGTTISPYLFFWQAAEEVEEEHEREEQKERLGRHRQTGACEARGASRTSAPRHTRATARYRPGHDGGLGDVLVHRHGHGTDTPCSWHRRTSRRRLRRRRRCDRWRAIWRVSSSRWASSAQDCWRSSAGGFGGLWHRRGVWLARGAFGAGDHARGFYAVIAAATLIGLALNFLGINPIAALVYTAVINGIVAVPLLVLLLMVANNRAIMGDFTNERLSNSIGILTTVVMSAAAIALVVSLLPH